MDKKKSSLKRVKGDANRYLYRLGNVYWIRAFAAGRVLQKSLDTELLSDARLFRDREMADFLGQKRSFNTKKKLVADLFPEFLATKSTKAKATQESMNNQWTQHLTHFSKLFPEEINEGEWITYVETKRKTHPSRKFFNDRKYLMMFLHWCQRNGVIQKIPKLEDVDPEIDVGRAYSDAEVRKLLEHAEPTLKLQILMGVTMGMRVSEILTLEWWQVDMKKRVITLPASKTKIRQGRSFGISGEVYDLLSLIQDRTYYVFKSPKDKTQGVGRGGNKSAWTSCRANSEVSGRFHDLRHTFLTNAFKHSTNPALICHYAGLSMEEAQRTYLHFTTDDTKVVSTLVKVGV